MAACRYKITVRRRFAKRTMSGVGVLLVLSSGVLMLTSGLVSADCTSKPVGGNNFSITSKKNQTGHWNALVSLKHGGNMVGDESKELGSWVVDITQTSEKCFGRETVYIVASVTAPPDQANIAPGYELVADLGYYKFHATLKSWTEARDICFKEGAHLVVINSEKELRTLQGIFVQRSKNDYFHVGFHDLYVEGQYMTVLGDSMASAGFSEFAKGNPKGLRYDCGAAHRDNLLHDSYCNNMFPFFCEQ